MCTVTAGSLVKSACTLVGSPRRTVHVRPDGAGQEDHDAKPESGFGVAVNVTDVPVGKSRVQGPAMHTNGGVSASETVPVPVPPSATVNGVLAAAALTVKACAGSVQLVETGALAASPE